mmetsp:Transcript_10292/g.29373  ORF Transcript_10292/g.29373 Transcript_10292/m.29373 type:complete len:98 (-) Transcript_10292:939-1232(-)|eukprot:CAMPEP_0117663512 /NCGR_PEP_ID=MMETSP0804-20121206/8652_1 /TAXON_ID=1074897 /ORGANISM="Tetraselmis astigmatica, Strain CCMP880" /LENGTH=97 /DNA_ID=CAMNT_0005470535 /DNA_START=141 /DNA_END=434 /DNA_ORIENTATION=+
MTPAADALRAVITTVKIQDPTIPVISNVTGKPMTCAEDVAALLPRQVCEGVQWEGSMRHLIEEGWTRMFEVGPGGQLKSISKKVCLDVGAKLVHVSP